MTDFKQKFRDGGFTKVSALLGIAMALVCVSIFNKTPRVLHSSSSVSASNLPLQEALQDSLSRFIKTKLVETAVPCADPTAFFQSHLFLRTYTASVGQMKVDPPAGLSGTAWNELFHGSMAANSFAGAALSRCPLEVLGTGGRFHFCLNVQRDAEAPRDSFLRTPLIFAEVSIQLMDRRSGKNLSCAQYLEPGRTTAGARVEYLLFSINENGEQLEVSKRLSKFNLNR